ncbi:MAG: valine--tRNA ligase [Bacteroidales bacterium]|nr:valine--tRNA ligase [Bacteroidales bacterium]
MEVSSKYNPQLIEDKWYRHWMEKGYFHSQPDHRLPYSIVIPPPNVTGVLHMGHMLNNTIQDILIRRARMKGFNVCWVPGTDHASIATEAKVVELLQKKGIEKKNISREDFLKHAWEWKEKHGGIILQQLKKLGVSCDWERTRFTMDEVLSESVMAVFIDLYNKGLIYRGVRMVNWDPKALTAVSDEEVVYQEVKSKLYYVRYKIEKSDNEYITIATTRPETILGDTAVCVHPDDERYTHLKGKRVLVPLIKRSVPLIFDEYVDKEFGTGALKITPAHDINDYQLGIKHNLETVNIFNDNGTLNEDAQLLVGVDRFKAREAIVPLLEKEGNLVKIEDYVNKVGFSERTQEVIEPKLSQQWFCKMETLAQPALKVVADDIIQFFPEKLKNVYNHWMENVKDWCISRQLWWGHRIPAYYLPNNEIVVAASLEEAFAIAKEKYPDLQLSINDLKQDEDVLDTWFSSWLWPISVFDGIRYPDNEDINYYYPTATLVTATDIIFFWVARMIMAGMEYRKEIPFRHVYFTGMVRDKLRRKMSKSLGNSPDPIELMDIYGADGVRMGMLLSSPAGNDLMFDESLCEQGRNFNNKIWNALRLLTTWKVDDKIGVPAASQTAAAWMQSRLNQVMSNIEDDFSKYRLSEALMNIYKCIWDDFCSTYLEIVKPAYQQPIDRTTYQVTIDLFAKLMQVLHPFMPFITEEVWHALKGNDEGDIIVSNMPEVEEINLSILNDFSFTMQIVEQVRRLRNEQNIPPKESLKLFVLSNDKKTFYSEVLIKLCNLSELKEVSEKVEDSLSFIVQNQEFFIPYQAKIDKAEVEQKLKSEIDYTQGFINAVNKKLSNENFIKNAPDKIIELERKKLADAIEKKRLLEEKLNNL